MNLEIKIFVKSWKMEEKLGIADAGNVARQGMNRENVMKPMSGSTIFEKIRSGGKRRLKPAATD